MGTMGGEVDIGRRHGTMKEDGTLGGNKGHQEGLGTPGNGISIPFDTPVSPPLGSPIGQRGEVDMMWDVLRVTQESHLVPCLAIVIKLCQVALWAVEKSGGHLATTVNHQCHKKSH